MRQRAEFLPLEEQMNNILKPGELAAYTGRMTDSAGVKLYGSVWVVRTRIEKTPGMRWDIYTLERLNKDRELVFLRASRTYLVRYHLT